ncbi:MotA/TolQ/ExbB proton channel family protein [Teredinibacter haidensis]|uniref:MotA/TolQ/ExbB proton channel family protein n=1 Tax=Teredinibacter haidensis TaxID=2731755 RepID=UPI000948D6FB|nr:MotA/TolQ/ExbB proton channel family protein [Teredinibacter haidensis]
MKMTFKQKLIAFAAAGTLVLSGSVFAQGDKAATLEELLQMVKNSQVSETKEHRQREAQFRKQKGNQATLLKQSEAEKLAEEQRSERLENQYKEQEVLVQAKRLQLDERLGSLKELFGHLTSTAGDLRTAIDTSIVSAQMPDRTQFINDLIDKMNSETKLPSIEEIERLWYELQRETVESGKVVKFTATVSDPSGDKAEREVVRIGNYNLVSDGKYLTYDVKSASLNELPRQPAGKFLKGAISLQNSTEGFSKLGIDPTGPSGGTLMKALINSPSVSDRWHQGKLVGYIISGVGAFALLLALFRFIILSGLSSKVSRQLKSDTANTNNPLGRVLKVASDNPNADTETLELKLEEAILKEVPPIEAGLNILKIISMVAPLLGLLGTVTGMIVTFQAITIFGAGDPKTMAGGISGALVTTVLGLVVAIPTVLLHTFLNGKAKRVIHVLEEESAGLIAEKSERSSK